MRSASRSTTQRPPPPIAMLPPCVAPAMSTMIAITKVMPEHPDVLEERPKRLPRVAVAETGGSSCCGGIRDEPALGNAGLRELLGAGRWLGCRGRFAHRERQITAAGGGGVLPGAIAVADLRAPERRTRALLVEGLNRPFLSHKRPDLRPGSSSVRRIESNPANVDVLQSGALWVTVAPQVDRRAGALRLLPPHRPGPKSLHTFTRPTLFDERHSRPWHSAVSMSTASTPRIA